MCAKLCVGSEDERHPPRAACGPHGAERTPTVPSYVDMKPFGSMPVNEVSRSFSLATHTHCPTARKRPRQAKPSARRDRCGESGTATRPNPPSVSTDRAGPRTACGTRRRTQGEIWTATSASVAPRQRSEHRHSHEEHEFQI